MTSKTETIRQVQSIIDMLEVVADWEDAAFMCALKLGIQGEKRKNRYHGTTDRGLIKCMQSKVYDIFEESIYPKPVVQHADLSGIDSPESFFTAYKEMLVQLYEKLHLAANTLIAPLLMKDLAEPLYERCACALDEIVKTNRILARGKLCGWTHDLMIYQAGYENVHDDYEKKEHGIGYPG